jgi:hypothetical protein
MTSAEAPTKQIKSQPNAKINDDRPAKRLKMDEAEKQKYATESAKLAKVEDYRDPMRGVARIKKE